MRSRRHHSIRQPRFLCIALTSLFPSQPFARVGGSFATDPSRRAVFLLAVQGVGILTLILLRLARLRLSKGIEILLGVRFAGFRCVRPELA